MYLVLIFLPLLGSILSGIFGRKLGVKGSQIITSSFVIITTILSLIIFFEVGINNTPVLLSLFTWIDSESFNIKLSFYFDSLTISMLIPVLIVSSLVHIYSIGYMKGDPHNQRFFSYLSLFTFMMIILVTSNNLLLMFVGWEGVGVCSYLLVNFWFTRIAANQSSISAFLTNRVGDCFLTVGMFGVLWSLGNLDYSTIFSLAPYINENIVIIVGMCLLIGAMAKSSQVGLHVWLPMAMEGPTPVSALIHAATMVTAGVYLLMRTSPLLEYSSTALLFCLFIGAITTVFSSLIGLFQQDIKKVIAYSTMSQLGMMVIAVGLSSYNLALFHLINHAFYKALLFLGAGSVIHAISDNQDFRKFGGLKSFLPLTYSVMLIASLSLIAFPFMTGFYSKDFIIEASFGMYSFSGFIIYIISILAAAFTTLYSVKVLYLTFVTNPNGHLISYKHIHEGDVFISIPLIVLAVFSIFFGFIFKDIFIGIGSDFFSDNALFIHPFNEILIDTEFAINYFYKLLPLILTITLSILSMLLSEFLPKIIIKFKFSNLGYNIYSLLNQRFFIELFYNKYITNIVLNLGSQTTKVLDKGSIEYFGPFGMEKSLTIFSNNLSNLDTKIVTNYALYILIGIMSFGSIYYISIFNTIYILLMLLSLFINFSFEKNFLLTKRPVIYPIIVLEADFNYYYNLFKLIIIIVIFSFLFKFVLDSYNDPFLINYLLNIIYLLPYINILSIDLGWLDFLPILPNYAYAGVPNLTDLDISNIGIFKAENLPIDMMNNGSNNRAFSPVRDAIAANPPAGWGGEVPRSSSPISPGRTAATLGLNAPTTAGVTVSQATASIIATSTPNSLTTLGLSIPSVWAPVSLAPVPVSLPFGVINPPIHPVLLGNPANTFVPIGVWRNIGENWNGVSEDSKSAFYETVFNILYKGNGFLSLRDRTDLEVIISNRDYHGLNQFIAEKPYLSADIFFVNNETNVIRDYAPAAQGSLRVNPTAGFNNRARTFAFFIYGGEHGILFNRISDCYYVFKKLSLLELPARGNVYGWGTLLEGLFQFQLDTMLDQVNLTNQGGGTVTLETLNIRYLSGSFTDPDWEGGRNFLEAVRLRYAGADWSTPVNQTLIDRMLNR